MSKEKVKKLKKQLIKIEKLQEIDLDKLHVKMMEQHRMILENTKHQLNASLESTIMVIKSKQGEK